MGTILVVAGLTWTALTPGADGTKPPLLTPKRLIETFLTNEALADQRYVDQLIQVRGKVVRVSRSKFPRPEGATGPDYVLELDPEGAGRARETRLDLLLVFPFEQRGALASLMTGQLVTVRGRCTARAIWSGSEARGEKDYSQVCLRDCTLTAR